MIPDKCEWLFPGRLMGSECAGGTSTDRGHGTPWLEFCGYVELEFSRALCPDAQCGAASPHFAPLTTTEIGYPPLTSLGNWSRLVSNAHPCLLQAH